MGRAISLLVGSAVFFIGAIIMPFFDETFRKPGLIVLLIIISIFMALGGLFFLSIYKEEVANEKRLYEENERLRKKVKELEENKNN